MAETVKYILDESGHKATVLVPRKVWEELKRNYEELQNKLNVFKSIQTGLKEVKQAKKTGRQLQTLKHFLK
jgi:hypothetical protein